MFKISVDDSTVEGKKTYSTQTIVKGTRSTYVLRVSDEPMPVNYVAKSHLNSDIKDLKARGYVKDDTTKTLIER